MIDTYNARRIGQLGPSLMGSLISAKWEMIEYPALLKRHGTHVRDWLPQGNGKKNARKSDDAKERGVIQPRLTRSTQCKHCPEVVEHTLSQIRSVEVVAWPWSVYVPIRIEKEGNRPPSAHGVDGSGREACRTLSAGNLVEQSYLEPPQEESRASTITKNC